MGKKKKNIVIYFLKMVVLFFAVLLAQQILSQIIMIGFKGERYGSESLFEMIWAGLVVILLLIYKNRYVFTQERESFKSGLKYIKPEIIMSTFFLGISLISIISSPTSVSFLSIINLLIYCFFVGIVEEFLCRGWLLNEFLERFSNNKKEIILSIIFSSFVFGVIHFLNVGSNQTFAQTAVQVINAGVSGIFLALVYYKTKNIWLAVFSHFYWDFSIMLMTQNQLVECYNSGASSSNEIIASIVGGLIIATGYLILCYWLYRKTDLYTKEDKESKKNYLIAIGIVIYIIGLFSQSLIGGDDNLVCPEYKDKTIKGDYNVVSSFYSKYDFNKTIDGTNYKFELTSNKDENKVLLKNKNTNKSIELSSEYLDYLLVENDDQIIIGIVKSYDVMLYGSIKYTDINDSDSFLDEVKKNLKEYHTPEIDSIYVLNKKDDNYNYFVISTNINKKMMFDKDNKLYFINFE